MYEQVATYCHTRQKFEISIRKIGGEYDVILDPESDYKDVFAELIETLARKYRQKVEILIDEYDKPIIDQIEDRNVAVANRNILRTFYEVIKGTEAYLGNIKRKLDPHMTPSVSRPMLEPG